MRLLNRIKRIPIGAKAAISYFLANFISKGLAYITTPLYTRLLTPDEYGQVSIFLTWLRVFGIVAMFCLSAGVFNNGMLEHPNERNEYSLSMLILSNIITLCFMGIIIALYPRFKEWVNLDYPLLMLMGIIFLFQPAYNFWIARQRYEMKYKAMAMWIVSSAFLSPVLAIICILKFEHNRVYARIFGAEIPMILMYLCFYIYLVAKGKGRIKTRYWKAALVFNLPLIPHYLSTYLLNSSDKMMISYMLGDTPTAYYSLAYSVAATVQIVWSAVDSSLLPYTYQMCSTKNYRSISNVTVPLLIGFGMICIIGIMIAPEMVAIMATADYQEAIYVIPPIVGGVFFQVQYYVYANVVYFYKKTNYVMIASITATVLNIALNYLLIPRFGYIAAGYTTLVCYFIQAGIDFIAMRKTVGDNIYDMKLVGLLSGAIFLVSIMSNYFYAYRFARYCIVVIMFLGCLRFFRRSSFLKRE